MTVLLAQNCARHSDDCRIAHRHEAVACLSVIIAERVAELAREICRRVKGGARRHHYRYFSVLRRRRNIHRRHKCVGIFVPAMGHLGYENFWLSHFCQVLIGERMGAEFA